MVEKRLEHGMDLLVLNMCVYGQESALIIPQKNEIASIAGLDSIPKIHLVDTWDFAT